MGSAAGAAAKPRRSLLGRKCQSTVGELPAKSPALAWASLRRWTCPSCVPAQGAQMNNRLLTPAVRPRRTAFGALMAALVLGSAGLLAPALVAPAEAAGPEAAVEAARIGGPIGPIGPGAPILPGPL